MRRLLVVLLLSAALGAAQTKRVLYVTHTAGFRHGSIEPSRQVMTQVAARNGLEVVATEDLSLIGAESLQGFDVVFFFTSGELPLSDSQKRDLLEFVRGGKGFGGAHSATDTLYTWPEYGEMIGGYFDGHPWTREAAVDVEDPDHPATRGLGNTFRILEEFYQFRAFSREHVRVLATLDTRSVNLAAEGVNRSDEDFALAWVRPYGAGRVFYTAFGHFDETWRDARFQSMLDGALRWLSGLEAADAAPRKSQPVVARAATLASPADVIAPGSLIEISGTGLTTGSAMHADRVPLPLKLAGTRVTLGGTLLPLVSVTPDRMVAYSPLEAGGGDLVVTSGGVGAGPAFAVRVEETAPGILAAAGRDVVSIYATGLGPVRAVSGYTVTVAIPQVLIGGRAAQVLFSGLAPGLIGVYQVNAAPPEGAAAGAGAGVVVEVNGRRSNEATLP